MDKAQAIAREVFQDQPQYVLMPIGSKGERTDTVVMHTREVTGHPSVPAEQLAKRLAASRTNTLCIAVTGVSSRFTAGIVIEALSLSTQPDLSGLRLLFVGDPSDRLTVQQAVEARAGTFYFRPE